MSPTRWTADRRLPTRACTDGLPSGPAGDPHCRRLELVAIALDAAYQKDGSQRFACAGRYGTGPKICAVGLSEGGTEGAREGRSDGPRVGSDGRARSAWLVRCTLTMYDVRCAMCDVRWTVLKHLALGEVQRPAESDCPEAPGSGEYISIVQRPERVASDVHTHTLLRHIAN
ncbi:hypothetical protein CALCODRAFT_32092 [Calocera cornea HHB12733]|uniref:Uncharacterized protein n=1 Tax=Calocera cornea HHB12733 TaxID=1353952 RepID=A0A165E232_9BASI|nr:hypothetical protein CALCODRAFT_32092 [Calocera cornea HHB12733]